MRFVAGDWLIAILFEDGPKVPTTNYLKGAYLMFENLLTVAGMIAIFWIACFVFYMFTSRQQKSIAAEIEQLKGQLGPESDESE